jgi:membrane protein XagC
MSNATDSANGALRRRPLMNGAMTRALAAAPIASLAFVAILALAAVAVSNGLIADDALRLWAGASTAADGQVPLGRIVAAYPTLPFLTTTLVAWLMPAGTPAPALVAAGVLALIAAFCFTAFRKAQLPKSVAAIATLLLSFHPALLRAVVAGPSDMFLAVFLLMFCLALYDLRARSGTSEVMAVGLTLMGLAFSHPLGAAIAFAAIPFLAFAVRPVLVAHSAFNVVIALIFPTVFAIAAFSYVSWIFPGDGWTFLAAPTQSLSLWTAAITRAFGDRLSGFLSLYASFAMAVALVLGAPIAAVMLVAVRRRRPLVVPAAIFAGIAIAATAISVLSGVFGDPTSIVIAAPALAAITVIRIPVARERPGLTIALLLWGWLGGFAGLVLIDPLTANYLHGAIARGGERIDALTAGGAVAKVDGVLVDIDNAPAFVLGRGGVHGILGPQSEPFTLAILFDRIGTPYVAVPDPQSSTGANDRLDKEFPNLFREGAPGYRVIYQNNTWRLFARTKSSAALKN